jgi:Mrp family chromosome partitioning ATPase
MSSNQPDPNQKGSNDVEVLAARLQERLDNREAVIIEKSSELDRLSKQLTTREKEIKQKTIEIAELKTKVAVKDTELEHKKPTIKNRILAVSVSLLFGVSTILFNLANSLLTNKPPEPKGTVIFDVAAIIYIICAVVTVLNAGRK